MVDATVPRAPATELTVDVKQEAEGEPELSAEDDEEDSSEEESSDEEDAKVLSVLAEEEPGTEPPPAKARPKKKKKQKTKDSKKRGTKRKAPSKKTSSKKSKKTASSTSSSSSSSDKKTSRVDPLGDGEFSLENSKLVSVRLTTDRKDARKSMIQVSHISSNITYAGASLRLLFGQTPGETFFADGLTWSKLPAAKQASLCGKIGFKGSQRDRLLALIASFQQMVGCSIYRDDWKSLLSVRFFVEANCGIFYAADPAKPQSQRALTHDEAVELTRTNERLGVCGMLVLRKIARSTASKDTEGLMYLNWTLAHAIIVNRQITLPENKSFEVPPPSAANFGASWQ